MDKTIKYVGTQRRRAELAETGRSSFWRPGQSEPREDAEAAILLATGEFETTSEPAEHDADTGARTDIVRILRGRHGAKLDGLTNDAPAFRAYFDRLHKLPGKHCVDLSGLPPYVFLQDGLVLNADKFCEIDWGKTIYWCGDNSTAVRFTSESDGATPEATAEAELDGSGGIAAVTIKKRGTSFVVPPQITIGPPSANGTNAKATATIDQRGRLSSIAVAVAGTLYATKPPVIVSKVPYGQATQMNYGGHFIGPGLESNAKWVQVNNPNGTSQIGAGPSRVGWVGFIARGFNTGVDLYNHSYAELFQKGELQSCYYAVKRRAGAANSGERTTFRDITMSGNIWGFYAEPSVLGVLGNSSIAGDVLTVGTVNSGSIATGRIVTGNGVLDGTLITANLGGGTGSGSTWRVSRQQNVASGTLSLGDPKALQGSHIIFDGVSGDYEQTDFFACDGMRLDIRTLFNEDDPAADYLATTPKCIRRGPGTEINITGGLMVGVDKGNGARDLAYWFDGGDAAPGGIYLDGVTEMDTHTTSGALGKGRVFRRDGRIKYGRSSAPITSWDAGNLLADGLPSQSGFADVFQIVQDGNVAVATCSISGNTLTVATIGSGTVAAGQEVSGNGVIPGTYITANQAGSGNGSTWTLSQNHATAVTGQTMVMTTRITDPRVGPISGSLIENRSDLPPYWDGSTSGRAFRMRRKGTLPLRVLWSSRKAIDDPGAHAFGMYLRAASAVNITARPVYYVHEASGVPGFDRVLLQRLACSSAMTLAVPGGSVWTRFTSDAMDRLAPADVDFAGAVRFGVELDITALGDNAFLDAARGWQGH